MGKQKEWTVNIWTRNKEDTDYVNIKTLSEEERKELGKRAYARLVQGLGYEPVIPKRTEKVVS